MELVVELQRALQQAVVWSLPLLGAAWVAGLVGAKLQEAAGAPDPAVSQLPRVLGVALAVALAGPWVARGLGAMLSRALGG
ncbi:MAG: flagellar biosynthetic protein FliQ [Polyangiaceae bacterium]|nr:flagellar biosynthetic protein FliQ [Polyangiaceae bacterium]